jgi:hypothetical protein
VEIDRADVITVEDAKRILTPLIRPTTAGAVVEPFAV